jgi:RNA polymerase sigma factor (sigma-70 family)
MTPNQVQSDEQLLEQFLTAKRDQAESAFEALMTRHGPMVMGVCRHSVNQQQDAEDAFQATFLTLARKAGSIRDRRVLGPWLHSVACRIAARTRELAARRRSLVLSGDEVSPGAGDGDPDRGEIRLIVHSELDRLPENYRTVVVHCYLEGKTYEEAARFLGRPVGTIKGQLSRARTILRRRLQSRRSLTVGEFAQPMRRIRLAVNPRATLDRR